MNASLEPWSEGTLASYELEPPFAPRRVAFVGWAACGPRADYAWVRLNPPFRPWEFAH
ncbi:MAG: hypothetical protein ACREMY_27195 [bacterium]